MHEISWSDFEAVELRAGTITRAEVFAEARKPAYKLWVDIGGLGMRTSSAQVTELYGVDDLVGRQVLCVCNFPPKRIGPWTSEVLVCGFYREDGAVVLAVPDMPVQNGARLG
jgi:tRNA-binding protein